MAVTDCIPCCAHCGERIELRINQATGQPSKAERRYCSARCGQAASQKRRPARKRAWGKRVTRDAKCAVCGARFDSYASTGAPGGWTRCCSNRCGIQSRRDNDGSRIRKAIKQSVLSVVTYRRHCDRCGLKYTATTRAGRYCNEACRPTHYAWEPEVRGCIGCGISFTQESKWQVRCSLKCKTESERRLKREAKARRRAVERGVQADQIDPIKVFERDRWRCHMCGRKTDRSKRGTPNMDAPELDHLVTLAEGGPHTWGNVACACRRCNHTKGSASRGQLGMNFAV